MPQNDELPPIGLPLEEPSRTRYFVGVAAVVLLCAAAVLAVGYGSLQLASGPCDQLHARALDGLRAEVEFFRKSGAALGLNDVEIHELRASTEVAGDSLEACCEQHLEGASGEGGPPECSRYADAMAALPAELAAAHGDAAAAKKAIRTASNQLRAIAGDLTDIANRTAPGTPASVAAGPRSGGTPED